MLLLVRLLGTTSKALVPSSVRHLLLLVRLLGTTSKALVPSSVALVTNSFLVLLVRHLFLVAWHLLLIASWYY